VLVAHSGPGLAAAAGRICFRIAATREERAAAFRLAYRSYLRAGLCDPNPHEMRVMPHHLLPTTEVFVAVCQGEVISTVSLVADGELGLPMESVYAEVVAERRRQGLVLAEVSCLADRRNELSRRLSVLLELKRLMAQYARRQGMDELLVAVHPRHVRFYERFLAFQRIGVQTVYPAVRGHPAVALSLSFARIDRQRPHNYERFFGEPLPEGRLWPQPISRADREYFRSMVAPGFVVGTAASVRPPEATDNAVRRNRVA